MSFELGTATDHYDLLNKIKTFVEATLAPAERYTVLRNLNSSVGTITSITHSGTTATVTFSAPVSLWTGDHITISGATDFLYNGSFAVTMLAGNMQCTYTMSGTPAANASGTLAASRDDRECIWVAPGLSGLEQIYMGIKTYQSIPSDYYNFKVGVFTGYVPGNSFETQPGTAGVQGLPLWNHSIPYTLLANGQRIAFNAMVDYVDEPCYMGKYLPYNTPYQYPYPVLLGASLPTPTATRYSDTAHVSYFQGTRANCVLRFVDGSWRQPDLYPVSGTRTLRNSNNNSGNAVGYYGLHSIVMNEAAPNNFGELDGIYYISGYNNATGNTLTRDGITYKVVRNIWRTGFKDYIAMRLA